MPEDNKQTLIKKKVKVTKVYDPKPTSRGGNAYNFMAVNEAGESHKYTAFSSTLAEVITEGAEFEVEYIEKVGEYQGEPTLSLNVRQIYIEGKPVRTAQKTGYRSYGESPEKILSIERQNTATNITQLRIAGVIDDKNPLYKKLLDWFSTRFDTPIPTATPKPEPKKTEVEKDTDDLWGDLEDTKQASKSNNVPEPEPKTEGTDLMNLEFANAGEFYTACFKHFKLTKSQADKEISMYDLTKPKQRNQAWQEIVSVYKK